MVSSCPDIFGGHAQPDDTEYWGIWTPIRVRDLFTTDLLRRSCGVAWTSMMGYWWYWWDAFYPMVSISLLCLSRVRYVYLFIVLHILGKVELIHVNPFNWRSGCPTTQGRLGEMLHPNTRQFRNLTFYIMLLALFETRTTRIVSSLNL